MNYYNTILKLSSLYYKFSTVKNANHRLLADAHELLRTIKEDYKIINSLIKELDSNISENKKLSLINKIIKVMVNWPGSSDIEKLIKIINELYGKKEIEHLIPFNIIVEEINWQYTYPIEKSIQLVKEDFETFKKTLKECENKLKLYEMEEIETEEEPSLEEELAPKEYEEPRYDVVDNIYDRFKETLSDKDKIVFNMMLDVPKAPPGLNLDEGRLQAFQILRAFRDAGIFDPAVALLPTKEEEEEAIASGNLKELEDFWWTPRGGMDYTDNTLMYRHVSPMMKRISTQFREWIDKNVSPEEKELLQPSWQLGSYQVDAPLAERKYKGKKNKYRVVDE